MEAVLSKFKSAIEPGRELVADEETLIKNRNINNALCPVTYIPRKPVPLGYERKSVVDAESGILCFFEFQVGKEIMRQKKYVQKHGSTTAMKLRLMEPFAGTFRTVYIDSWFQSV